MMQLIPISLLLAASLASTVQARHLVEPHLRPRRSEYGSYPTPSTVVVSPLPGSDVPMATGVSPVVESISPQGCNKTLTYTQGTGSSKKVITTTVHRTATLTHTETVRGSKQSDIAAAAGGLSSHTEPTTTVTSRSTVTRTTTVDPVHPSAGDEDGVEQTEAAGDGHASSTIVVAGGGDSAPAPTCAAVTTVTETIKSTVTVTASPSRVPHENPDSEEVGSLSGSSSELPVETSQYPGAPPHSTSTESGPPSSSSSILPAGTSDLPGAPTGTSAKVPAYPTVSSSFTTAQSTPSVVPTPSDGAVKPHKAKECTNKGSKLRNKKKRSHLSSG